MPAGRLHPWEPWLCPGTACCAAAPDPKSVKVKVKISRGPSGLSVGPKHICAARGTGQMGDNRVFTGGETEV